MTYTTCPSCGFEWLASEGEDCPCCGSSPAARHHMEDETSELFSESEGWNG
jgi:rubrerythrin